MEYGGIITRGFAWLIDIACMVAIVLTLTNIGVSEGYISRDWSAVSEECIYQTGCLLNTPDGHGWLIAFLVSYLYPVLFVASSWGGTPGKRIFRLSVLTRDGEDVYFWRSLMRHIFFMIGCVPIFLLLSIIMILFTYERLTFHDLICRTRVVRDE